MSDYWRIKSWDRSLGRGEVTSDHAGDLPFDASAALVSDFRVGERVILDLKGEGTTFRVTKIVPDDPRFRAPNAEARNVPALEARLAKETQAEIAKLPTTLDYRVSWLAEDLVVQGDDDGFAYGHCVEIKFVGAEYLELPTAWTAKSFRLADDAERAYLAERTELSSRSVALRIVEEDRRIFFVVSAGIVFSSVR